MKDFLKLLDKCRTLDEDRAVFTRDMSATRLWDLITGMI